MYFLIATFVIFVPIAYLYNVKFLQFIENRDTLVELFDPLLEVLPTVNTSRTITVLTVANLGFMAIGVSEERLSLYLWTMICCMILRCICLYFCPLRVHRDHAILNDIIINSLGRNNRPPLCSRPVLLWSPIKLGGHYAHLFRILLFTTGAQSYCVRLSTIM